MTNFIPPDPTMAVGPNHIISCVNSIFRIFDKDGTILKTIGAGAWWAPVWPDESGDPQVIYDHYAGRWFLAWMQINTSNQTAGTLIAYSDDDDPLGTWYVYRLPLNSWGDYPHIGFDEEAIYIMTRQVTFSGFYQYNQIRILDKAQLYSSNAGPVTYTDIWNIRTPGGGPGSTALDVIHPSISYTPGNGGWFYWARGSIGGIVPSNFYAIYKIINPLTAPRIRGKVLSVTTYYTPPNANQLGGGTRLETIGWISRAPVVRDDTLYVAHDVRNSTNNAYSSIKYLKVDLNTVLIVEDVEFGSDGKFYLYPALTVDKDHNIAITFSRSADTEYVGAYYSTKHASDPPGLSPSQAFAEGQGNYDVTFGQGRNRWGDYMGIYLDPDNFYDVWMLTEYASATNTWGTYIGAIRMAPYPGAHAVANPETVNFGDVEVGTTSDTLPDTLVPYDTLLLEFTCVPSVTGTITETYPIANNDPDFTGLTLEANGYRIQPALDKTFYASSGSENSGDILTIDETTGAGTILGPSLFDEIKSISIDPNSGIIYGLNARTADSDIVKVNAGEGDSYYLFTLDIQQLAGIAFDTTGTLYTISRSGDIYTVDLTTGVTTFIVDAVSSYAGITFNPVTNELWASAQSFVPPNKDAVFTVNLISGDTTIVGHTGLGKVTNDIVFDENLNLYGVIGSATEINDFINIDASTGAGTIVGSVGYKDILGLAYEVTGVTSVEGEEDNTVPTEFVLSQNYPNPFNPSTSIEFSVPVNSNVTLTIYNLLGQLVTTLVNEEMSAGNYSIIWNGTDKNGLQVTSGVYLYKMKANGNNGTPYSQTKKMILLK